MPEICLKAMILFLSADVSTGDAPKFFGHSEYVSLFPCGSLAPYGACEPFSFIMQLKGRFFSGTKPGMSVPAKAQSSRSKRCVLWRPSAVAQTRIRFVGKNRRTAGVLPDSRVCGESQPTVLDEGLQLPEQSHHQPVLP